MNKMLGFSLSKVLTTIINNTHINENIRYQLIYMTNDICINLVEHNKFLLTRLDHLEKRIIQLEELNVNNKINEKQNSVLVTDDQK